LFNVRAQPNTGIVKLAAYYRQIGVNYYYNTKTHWWSCYGTPPQQLPIETKTAICQRCHNV